MSKDPYKYFRIEARELLEELGQGVLNLEKEGAGRDLIGRLLRLAHTLKGAARVVKQTEISDLAHALEDVLAPYRDGAALPAHDEVNRLLGLLDACSARLTRLGQAPEPEPAGTARRLPEDTFETVRVDIAEMDALLYGLSEASSHLGALREEAAAVAQVLRTARKLTTRWTDGRSGKPDGDRNGPGTASAARALAEEVRAALERIDRNLRIGVDRAERDLRRTRDKAGDLRLLPASTIFGALERSARDAADALQKRIDWEATGGDNRLDAHVLRALRDALIHVVRNAVAHGIESEADRTAAGKPPLGRVRMRVERRGSRVVFLCQDDGRGLDVEAIRQAALVRGLAAPAGARSLTLEDAVRLIFQGGVSTSRAVSNVSGRGVGLDVVRETVARLKGEVNLQSEPARGTTIEISVPVSIESLAVLAVSAGGLTTLLPFDSVRQTLRLQEEEIARSAAGASILFQNQAVPFLPLATILRRNGSRARQPRFCSVVVVQARASLAALGVDRLEGILNVVMRPLPPLSGRGGAVAGAALDEEGNPQLVLDPAGLVEIVHAGPGQPDDRVPALKAPLLVIDDSLTTRMLEQSILESAGYRVDLAVSGEEALRKARQNRYALFVVDIEMPGMDGFEFIERTRGDPVLRAVPSILVTSRAAAEDRHHGEQAGARAYIVKSEFDEGVLLRTIRDLIG